jgi:radical S-adenosyl methionine domain-containing protein 2
MNHEKLLPPSVNFHLWQPCNMSCRGCFARFHDVRSSVLPKGHLPREQAISVVEKLAARFCKITFAGGEPTLCPWLGDMMGAARRAGATTMLVTNGSRLDGALLDALAPSMDWLALSIDSSDPAVHERLGRRTGRGALATDTYLEIAARARALGCKVKVNTVVNAENVHEDMAELLVRLRPDRWKLLQVLPVEGQNDDTVGPLLIEAPAFRGFVERHRLLLGDLVESAVEDNTAMTGSYAMVDPAGRFFDNTAGHHTYSRPILDVGLDEAWRDVTFLMDRFVARGGEYAW